MKLIETNGIPGKGKLNDLLEKKKYLFDVRDLR